MQNTPRRKPRRRLSYTGDTAVVRIHFFIAGGDLLLSSAENKHNNCASMLMFSFCVDISLLYPKCHAVSAGRVITRRLSRVDRTRLTICLLTAAISKLPVLESSRPSPLHDYGGVALVHQGSKPERQGVATRCHGSGGRAVLPPPQMVSAGYLVCHRKSTPDAGQAAKTCYEYSCL